MTPQSSRYTASGDLSVYAGEALAIELVILRDGVPIDPTGREGALTLWRTTNLEPILPSIAGVIVDRVHSKYGPIKVPRYVLPGSASRLVFDKHRTGTGYQIASANADGLDFQLVGKVTTRPTADLIAAQGDGEPPVVQVTVETRVQTIVVDMRGAPGLSPWEALGITQAEYEADVRQPAVDAAAEAKADVDEALLSLGEAFGEQQAHVDDVLDAQDAAIAAGFEQEAEARMAALIGEAQQRQDDVSAEAEARRQALLGSTTLSDYAFARRVRVDASQEFDDEEMAQARANIEAVGRDAFDQELAQRVRVDAAQAFAKAQQRQGLSNLGVPYRFAPELYRQASDPDDTLSFARAIQAANGAPIVCNGVYDVRDLVVGDLPLNLVGTGALMHSAGFGIMTVSRTAGSELPITSIVSKTIAASVSDGNAWTATVITTPSVAGIRTGDVFTLYSQDAYPWSADAWPALTNPKVYQSNLIEVIGLGLDYVAGTSTTPFKEGDTVVGATSGASGVVRAVGLAATGMLMFASIAGAFVAGEQLKVAGVAKATANAAATVVTGETLEYAFTTSPALRKMPKTPCRIALSIGAIGDTDSRVGAANRVSAIVLEGVYQPETDNIIYDAWTRVIVRRSCYKGRAKVHVHRMPNDADESEGAYSYPIELVAADYGADLIVTGGNTRHMKSSNTLPNSTFANSKVWTRGTVKYATVTGSGSNCWNAAFDTHAGALFTTYRGCIVTGPDHGGRSTSGSVGYQNRGYGTKMISCLARRCVIGFVDQSLGQAAGFPFVNEYTTCTAEDFLLAGFLNSSIASKNFGELVYRTIISRGDRSSTMASIGLQSTNAARIKVLGHLAEGFTNAPMRFNGGDITLDEILFDCTKLGTLQVSGVRFDAAANVYLGRISAIPGPAARQPASMLRWHNPANVTFMKSGRIGSMTSKAIPLMENSNGGIATVQEVPESTGVAT